jgi:hypothetical protein
MAYKILLENLNLDELDHILGIIQNDYICSIREKEIEYDNLCIGHCDWFKNHVKWHKSILAKMSVSNQEHE